MSKLPYIFLIMSIIAALIGFSGLGSPIVTGLGKAMGGVFFIMFFILRTVGREQIG